MQLKIQPNYYSKTTFFKNKQNSPDIINYTSFKGNGCHSEYPEKRTGEKQLNKWWFGGHSTAKRVTVEEREKAKIKAAQKLKEAELEAELKIKKELQRKIEEKSYPPKPALKSEYEILLGKIQSLNNIKGFAKIAGYAEQKDILLDHLGIPIALQKVGHPAVVPSGVLFFGPNGTGKTTFAEALAGQLDCYLIQFQDCLDDKENFKNLLTEAQESQKRFDKDGTRTIIKIDCCERMLAKDSRIISPLKNLMDNLSEKYHCTIFATANHPEEIDDILLRDGRFDIKVGLPPADKENALAVIKHYAQDFADESVNYDELAEYITKVQPDEAFSNARIKNCVQELAKAKVCLGRKISHSELLARFMEKNPDISTRTMDIFKKQIEYIKHI